LHRGSRLASYQQNRAVRVFEDCCCCVTEIERVSGAPAHAHHDQIVTALLGRPDDGAVGRHIGLDGRLDLVIVAVRKLDNVLEDRLFLLARPESAFSATAFGALV